MTLKLIRVPHWMIPHGFSTRHGGFSTGPYAGLNLDDREDQPEIVIKNRALLANKLNRHHFAMLRQVHGADVIHATTSGIWEGDALVTATPDLVLTIATADCFPILLHDPVAGVIGAAHAGWRGTVQHIVLHTLSAMQQLGAQPRNTRAAIGPGICAQRYEVSAQVIDAMHDAGLEQYIQKNYADLGGANQFLLQQAGLRDIWRCERCSTEADFYSFRRDAGKTGRMWAVISI